VSATQPYYRSTYALVYPKGKGLDGVRSGADLEALPAGTRGQLRIGIYDKSPASLWLVRHGLEAQAMPYPMMSPDPEQYPGEILERDLTEGKIDAAIVWGPIAGYYAKRVRSAELVVVPLKSEPGIKFDYEIAMGVRYGEPEWKASVQKLITENQAAISAILREYNVPLVNERGDSID
jgi:mxaJ protein